ncbi:MAG: hypothetical protein NC095_06285 [Muribaculum sp.]|nr:hypothetical protein [Muribaculum sp.]
MKQFDQEIIRHCVFSAISFTAAIFMLVCLCAVCGCTKTVYLPSESHSVSNDTLIRTRWLTDYRTEKDSVFVLVKGDSVYVQNTRWRTREVEKHDTVYLAKRDTVSIREPYPMEKTVEVAKPLTWWQKTLMWMGIASLAIIVLLAIRWHKRR